MDRRLNRFRAVIVVLALLLAVGGCGCSVAKKIEPVKTTGSAVTTTQKQSNGVEDQFTAKMETMNGTLRAQVESQSVEAADGKLNVTVVTLDDRYLPALADQLTRYGKEVAKDNSLEPGTFKIAIPNGGISWESTEPNWEAGRFDNVRAHYHVNYSIQRLYGHYGGMARNLVQ